MYYRTHDYYYYFLLQHTYILIKVEPDQCSCHKRNLYNCRELSPLLVPSTYKKLWSCELLLATAAWLLSSLLSFFSCIRLTVCWLVLSCSCHKLRQMQRRSQLLTSCSEPASAVQCVCLVGSYLLSVYLKAFELFQFFFFLWVRLNTTQEWVPWGVHWHTHKKWFKSEKENSCLSTGYFLLNIFTFIWLLRSAHSMRFGVLLSHVVCCRSVGFKRFKHCHYLTLSLR